MVSWYRGIWASSRTVSLSCSSLRIPRCSFPNLILCQPIIKSSFTLGNRLVGIYSPQNLYYFFFRPRFTLNFLSLKFLLLYYFKISQWHVSAISHSACWSRSLRNHRPTLYSITPLPLASMTTKKAPLPAEASPSTSPKETSPISMLTGTLLP